MLQSSFFFFNDTATTEIYTLSLHDALPISILNGITRIDKCGYIFSTTGNSPVSGFAKAKASLDAAVMRARKEGATDRKSTRLNSSHANISYAVFCLKKKNNYVISSVISLSP